MSYIQIEIGGKLRGLKFTQGTTILLQNSPVIEMSESERMAFGTQYIIWAGLKTNCAIKGERFTKTVDAAEVAATIEDVFEWCESLDVKIKEDVINIWVEVNAFKAELPEQPPLSDEEKKNTQPVNITTEPSVTESPVEN